MHGVAPSQRDFEIEWPRSSQLSYWAVFAAGEVFLAWFIFDPVLQPVRGFAIVMAVTTLLSAVSIWIFLRRVVLEANGLRVPTGGGGWWRYRYGDIKSVELRTDKSIRLEFRAAPNQWHSFWRFGLARKGCELRLKEPDRFTSELSGHLPHATQETRSDGTVFITTTP
jgi:hypothetical protein